MMTTKHLYGLRHWLCLTPNPSTPIGENPLPLRLIRNSILPIHYPLAIKTPGACALGLWTSFPVTCHKLSEISSRVCLIIVFIRQRAALAAGARMMMKKAMMSKRWCHLLTNRHQFHPSLPAKSKFIHKQLTFDYNRRGHTDTGTHTP